MDIYSDTDFAALENDIIESYKIEGQNSLDRCIKLSIWQEQLLTRYDGNINHKEYKKSSVHLRNAASIARTQMHKDIAVGNYLREHEDETLRDMPKTKIYNTYCKVKKVSTPKVPKPDKNAYAIQVIKDSFIKNGASWEKFFQKVGLDPQAYTEV